MLADQLEIGHLVRFYPGTYEEGDLSGIMLSAAVACYPRGAGLGPLHAAAYGLPVCVGEDLGSHGPETQALVRSGGAVVFEDRNPEDLASTLSQLLRDPLRSAAFGENARSVVRRDLSIESMVEGLATAISTRMTQRLGDRPVLAEVRACSLRGQAAALVAPATPHAPPDRGRRLVTIRSDDPTAGPVVRVLDLALLAAGRPPLASYPHQSTES